MNDQNTGNVFSNWFEKLLLNLLEKYFDRSLQLAEERVNKPVFIQQKNVPLYYDGVSLPTLKKYEDLGLKRCEPVEGGNIYYPVSELDRFMLSYSNTTLEYKDQI